MPSNLELSRSEETRRLGLPFADAAITGNLLWSAGQIGNRPGTLELVPGGIAAEARQAMENLRVVLEANGSDMAHVAKVTVFLADMADWPAFNAVYVTFFGDRLPARSAFAASGLALGARVELECVAVLRG
jgi:reactive intermediate/imine deaminase